jgi:hypothetical protein
VNAAVHTLTHPSAKLISRDGSERSCADRREFVTNLRLDRRRDLFHKPASTQLGEHFQKIGALSKCHRGKPTLDLIPAEWLARARQDREDGSLELSHGATLFPAENPVPSLDDARDSRAPVFWDLVCENQPKAGFDLVSHVIQGLPVLSKARRLFAQNRVRSKKLPKQRFWNLLDPLTSVNEEQCLLMKAGKRDLVNLTTRLDWDKEVRNGFPQHLSNF